MVNGSNIKVMGALTHATPHHDTPTRPTHLRATLTRYDLVDELACLLRDSTIAIRAFLCSQRICGFGTSSWKQKSSQRIDPPRISSPNGAPAHAAALSPAMVRPLSAQAAHGVAARALAAAALWRARNSASPMRAAVFPHTHRRTCVNMKKKVVGGCRINTLETGTQWT